MLTLYYLPSCPFCQRVLQIAENLNISLELKDISEDAAAEQTLIEQGGKAQVPYLVDTEKDVTMYESSDIIEHLREHYAHTGSAEPPKPRVHVGSAVCESCEG